jgi:diadenosine tetraphosphate (Ap4A) HIT family hydrolase
LGSLVLVCREPVRSFADVSPQGFAEMRQVIGLIEATLREVATFERINYLMLMMVDPDVHMHVIPRYQATRSFAGVEFADAGWPGPPMLDAAVLLDGATSAALLARLRDVWAGCAAEDRAP